MQSYHIAFGLYKPKVRKVLFKKFIDALDFRGINLKPNSKDNCDFIEIMVYDVDCLFNIYKVGSYLGLYLDSKEVSVEEFITILDDVVTLGYKVF